MKKNERDLVPCVYLNIKILRPQWYYEISCVSGPTIWLRFSPNNHLGKRSSLEICGRLDKNIGGFAIYGFQDGQVQTTHYGNERGSKCPNGSAPIPLYAHMWRYFHLVVQI